MTKPSCDIDIRVRYAETDRMGLVHHSRFLVYFEMGRTELLRQGGVAYRDLEDAGVFFVVARCSVRYAAPARYDDVLRLTTTVERMTAARIDHSYALKRQADGLLVAEAQTTLACVDAAGQVIAIPEFIRRAADGQCSR